MLAAALILDALAGEPEALWRRVPHPVAAMGRLIGWLDRRLNIGPHRRRGGVLAVATLCAVSVGAAALVQALPLGWVLTTLGAAVLLAQRSLAEHAGAVADGLDRSIEDGRAAVSRIVGRDPQSLDRAGVARAAIESTAENFSDGVVAPAFWFLLAGLPGIVLYKAVNTADSMIGHRDARYAEFGWAAARLDDLLNWIPARLSGVLICLAGRQTKALRVVWRDARLHRSPNAGWPEAATAAVLDLALAGPRVYGGVIADDPYLNPDGGRDPGPAEIRRAVALIWRAWGVLLAFAVLAALLRLVS
jgi:adenosylcobinamide-phosphate synthase